jgi:hypothetical protein
MNAKTAWWWVSLIRTKIPEPAKFYMPQTYAEPTVVLHTLREIVAALECEVDSAGQTTVLDVIANAKGEQNK